LMRTCLLPFMTY